MSNLLAEIQKVVGLNGDTYSSAEVIGLLAKAHAEIERLRTALKTIGDNSDDMRVTAFAYSALMNLRGADQSQPR